MVLGLQSLTHINIIETAPHWSRGRRHLPNTRKNCVFSIFFICLLFNE